MEEQSRHDLFDRYIRGELQSTELDAFLEALESDAELQQALDMHRLLVRGIREHEREELKAYMNSRARVRFMGNPFTRTWTLLSAAIILLFGVVYFVFEGNLNEEALSDNTHAAGSESKPTAADSSGSNNKGAKTTQTRQYQTDNSINDDTLGIYESMPEQGVNSTRSLEEYPEQVVQFDFEDNLPVRVDTRMHETIISLSLAQNTDIERSKVDSGANDGSKKFDLTGLNERVLVQFWKSPINYKGYRFDGRKLELFGLDSFTNVSLKYRVIDVNLKVADIYLKYGEAFYKLEDDNRYHPYIKESNPAIIEELK